MIVVTSGLIEGRDIEKALGLVRGTAGLCFRMSHIDETVPIDCIDKASDRAIEVMIQNAEKMGADAIVSVRHEIKIFTVDDKPNEKYVAVNYIGTAVKLKQKEAKKKEPGTFY